MSLTNDQLLSRIVAIEERLDNIETALNNLVTKRFVNNTLAIKQEEIRNLQDRVTTLESSVQVIQNSLE